MTPPTLQDFVAGTWKADCYGRCKPSTRQRVDSALRTQLLPTFGAQPLDQVRRDTVHLWFDRYSRAAPAGANRTLDVLRQIFNHAIACGHVATNPVRDVRRNPRPSLTRFLSRPEIDRLHAALDAHRGRGSGEQQAEIIRLLLLTGCRKGEIVHLRWSEVNGESLHLTDSKTGSRTVALNAQARAVLARQPPTGSAYVFPSLSDSSRSRSDELSLWRKVRHEAGIGDVRLHDLRHTFASHAVMRSVPLPVVSRLLGHAQPRMTLRYAHVSDRETEVAAERIGRAIATLMSEPADSAQPEAPTCKPHRRPVVGRAGTKSGDDAARETQSVAPCSGLARSECGRIVALSDRRAGSGPMQITRLRAKNQITLPASVVATAGVPHPVSWTQVCATQRGVGRTPRGPRVACDRRASRGASTGCSARRTRRRRRARRRDFETPDRRWLAP